MNPMMRWLLALSLLLLAPSAEARSSAYQSYNVSGRGSAQWQGFSPTWIAGVKFWLRADLGITAVAGPVTATGTTPPTVTLAGTPTAAQTASATPYVELDCTTLGALGTSKYTVKVNGVTTATNVASAASGVVLTGSGLTAGWAVGASATNDVYTANVVASAWADQRGSNNVSQATASRQPTVVNNASYAGQPTLHFVGGSTQFLSNATLIGLAQPWTLCVVGQSTSGTGAQQNFVGADATIGSGIEFESTNVYGLYAGTHLLSANAVRTPQAFCGVANGVSNSALYVNNFATAAVTGNANTNSFGITSGGLAIGALSSGAAPLTGEEAEVILVAGSPSGGQRAQLAAYFANRYGVASY